MTVPGEKIALFIDGANLYATAKSLGFDIDYKRLLREFQSRGYLLRAFYYTAVIEDQEYSSIRPLIDWLDYNGYSVVTKATKEFVDQTGRRKVKGNMDIELAVDAMEIAGTIDHMVLFSGDGDFRSLIEAVQRKGVRVTVVSTISTQPPMVADELRRQADMFVDIVTLQSKIGRDPAERVAREPRSDEREPPPHTPQFLQRPPTPQRATPAPTARKTTTTDFRISGADGCATAASLGVTARAARGLPYSVRLARQRAGLVQCAGPLLRSDRRAPADRWPGARPARCQSDRAPIHWRLCRRAALRHTGEFGFARGEYGAHPDDGLELVDCRITNAVRCVPPENKPTPEEIKTCRDFLLPTITEMKKLRAVVALGRIAHDSAVRALGYKKSDVAFGHGNQHQLGSHNAVLQLSLLPLQHEHWRAHAGDVSRSLCECPPLPGCLKPGDHFFGALVGWKNRVERFGDRAVVERQGPCA